MKKCISALLVLALFAGMALWANAGGGEGRGSGPIVFVTSQNLYYDSIVVKDPLPNKGRFQTLSLGPNGLETTYGPGDLQYVGGRWVEDIDGDGVNHYFLCPLLGPGRPNP